ncbi:hypothetical protein AsFPU1_2237 [Aphanothece sacrum FPU1]|uniref:Uncharacterized protein n=1 Tax=Aphanothece sacrum FPU1 TaxID=1920663 RepID=A0A401IIA2_APHSA|nr:hypothetical protein AsFPU1_2237 [Aphanothece sacrum FPU1]
MNYEFGHGVLENVCGDDLAGVAMPSQESVKQKLLSANLRIPSGGQRLTVGVCQCPIKSITALIKVSS